MQHTDRAARTGSRTRWAWYAYDFGNTSVEFAIPLYLTTWFVVDLGVPAVLFGIASAISSWAIGLSGPYIGVNADEKGRRRQWFIGSALIATILLGSLNLLPDSGTSALATLVVLAVIANYFFQLSSLIYNASLLSASGGVNVVSVSSIGMGLSYLGGVAGVLVVEAIISGRLIPGVSGRGYALVPAAVLFIACTIPSLFARGLWQSKEDVCHVPEGNLHKRIRKLWREAAREHRAGYFLAGYFALNSAIMGLTLYLPLHLDLTTGLKGFHITLALGAVVLFSAVGAGIVALLRPSPRLVRRIVLVGMGLWALNAFALALSKWLPMVILFVCLHGLFSGALVPTIRGAFAQIFRSDYQALAFGLYGAVQRTSQGLGAALWPIASGAMSGPRATALGIAAMGVVALIGVPLFRSWKTPA